jgi:hypothetical protein
MLPEPDRAEEALALVRKYESAARTIADDESLSVRARCTALLELSRRGRREEAPGLIESGIWRGSRAFLEGDRGIPRDVTEACRRLLRQGRTDCPTCRRPLPSAADLDRWRELSHHFRRPA